MGRAAEPTAEGQIVIECQARKPQPKAFNIPNIIGTSTEYKVRGILVKPCLATSVRHAGPRSTCAQHRSPAVVLRVPLLKPYA
jgi:hypothetical protein